MINTRKFINSSLKTSNTIFKDILSPLNKRIGFINGTTPTIPIYFYRCIGLKKNEQDYYSQLYRLDNELSKLNNLYIKFISNIPFKNDSKIIDKIQLIWNTSTLNNFNANKINILITLLKNSNLLPSIDNSLLNASIEESFSCILDLYLKKEPNINLTKVKNFNLKLITWINDFIPNLMKDFNISSSSNKEILNPKITYFGNIKKHEVYFLIFLSCLGCDVIYINSPSDCDFSLIDKEATYSKILDLPNKSEFKINKLKNIVVKSNVSLNVNSAFNISNYNSFITSSLKTSNNILKDFYIPLDKRGNFVGKPLPIIPVYFYRYIGIKENKDEYYNDLYTLDKKLSTYGDLYTKFTNQLSVENNSELINKTSKIWRNITGFDKTQKSMMMELLIESEVFPNFREKILTCSVIKSFNSVLELYLHTESNTNIAKIKNFVLKLLMWTHKFIPNLFKKFDYLKNSNSNIYNPKIIYYGNIKKHEAYFLIFLSKIGCDVLYINSYEDNIFTAIDKNQEHTKLLKLNTISQLKEFPSEEIIIRQETTAFKASQEISNVIFNEEDGLYKPWQFENYKTSPLTLKTTYDELRLLWKEEARMRPGFKIENQTVYIPNLFAKVSGVHSDLNIYWNEFSELKTSENVIFVPKIPYTKTNYSKQDLYRLQYCIDKDGLIIKENLFKNNLYKFSYLKTSLQNAIIDKTNQLLKLSIFKNSTDNQFTLKTLMTILTIDKEILELIQKFDFPFKIPKIIIYDNDENIFSDEDSIILAFLNLIGFDIIIFTPTGYNNIEAKILEKYYDIHKLENIKFDLQIPNLNGNHKNKSKSFWSNLFG
ncbi:hypothetical protein OW763_11310 [Clostridium aestuarii]|uniref:Putative component of 'biosynthetic module' domain-containing protein n=1 Tax=Clostridium aestuarii TaxID=338193 RepID=A0ABT4D403_9CLOT|nr:YceG family protein [Clostridium aestuarii]MCY6484930.1 hypothetical protein [Clostridium aestuarii]